MGRFPVRFSVLRLIKSPKNAENSALHYLRLWIRLSLTVEEDVLLILRAPFVNPEAVRHEHLGAGVEGEGLRAGQPSQNRALFPKFLHEKSYFLLPSCLSGWLAQVLLSAACLSWREDLIGFSEVRSYLMPCAHLKVMITTNRSHFT